MPDSTAQRLAAANALNGALSRFRGDSLSATAAGLLSDMSRPADAAAADSAAPGPRFTAAQRAAILALDQAARDELSRRRDPLAKAAQHPKLMTEKAVEAALWSAKSSGVINRADFFGAKAEWIAIPPAHFFDKDEPAGVAQWRAETEAVDPKTRALRKDADELARALDHWAVSGEASASEGLLARLKIEPGQLPSVFLALANGGAAWLAQSEERSSASFAAAVSEATNPSERLAVSRAIAHIDPRALGRQAIGERWGLSGETLTAMEHLLRDPRRWLLQWEDAANHGFLRDVDAQADRRQLLAVHSRHGKPHAQSSAGAVAVAIQTALRGAGLSGPGMTSGIGRSFACETNTRPAALELPHDALQASLLWLCGHALLELREAALGRGLPQALASVWLVDQLLWPVREAQRAHPEKPAEELSGDERVVRAMRNLAAVGGAWGDKLRKPERADKFTERFALAAWEAAGLDSPRALIDTILQRSNPLAGVDFPPLEIAGLLDGQEAWGLLDMGLAIARAPNAGEDGAPAWAIKEIGGARRDAEGRWIFFAPEKAGDENTRDFRLDAVTAQGSSLAERARSLVRKALRAREPQRRYRPHDGNLPYVVPAQSVGFFSRGLSPKILEQGASAYLEFASDLATYATRIAEQAASRDADNRRAHFQPTPLSERDAQFLSVLRQPGAGAKANEGPTAEDQAANALAEGSRAAREAFFSAWGDPDPIALWEGLFAFGDTDHLDPESQLQGALTPVLAGDWAGLAAQRGQNKPLAQFCCLIGRHLEWPLDLRLQGRVRQWLQQDIGFGPGAWKLLAKLDGEAMGVIARALFRSPPSVDAQPRANGQPSGNAMLRRLGGALTALAAANAQQGASAMLLACSPREDFSVVDFTKGLETLERLLSPKMPTRSVTGVDEAMAYVSECREREQKAPELARAAAEHAGRAGRAQALADLAAWLDFFERSEDGVWRELPRRFGGTFVQERVVGWHALLAAREQDKNFSELRDRVVAKMPRSLAQGDAACPSAIHAELDERRWPSPLGAASRLLDGDVWTAEPLSSAEALFAEGKAMHHCVSSYATNCAGADSRIFSILKNGERHCTLELKSSDPEGQGPRVWRQEQNRGPCNKAIEGKAALDFCEWATQAVNESALANWREWTALGRPLTLGEETAARERLAAEKARAGSDARPPANANEAALAGPERLLGALADRRASTDADAQAALAKALRAR
jgi:hypothetical protein